VAKVLFLPAWYPSSDRPLFGIFVKEHAQAARLYDDVAVLYGEPSPSRDGLFQCWFAEEEGLPTWRFRFRGLPVPKTWFVLYGAMLFKAFQRVRREWGRPDLIHAVEMGGALGAWLLRQAYGIPYVVSEHWTAFVRHDLTRPQAALARWTFSRAQRVLGENRNFPREFARYGINCGFHWVPNCVDLNLFYPPPAHQDRELMVLHGSFMDKKKRVTDLVRAFAQVRPEFPQARLELVGDGEERSLAERLAGELLSPRSYVFHGLLPKPRLAELMRRATVFALPSQYENQACVLLEAMACGTPVIATPVGDIPYIVGPEQGILVEPGDLDGLAAALRAVLGGETTFQASGIAAYAARNFSREAVGRLLHEEHERAARLGP